MLEKKEEYVQCLRMLIEEHEKRTNAGLTMQSETASDLRVSMITN